MKSVQVFVCLLGVILHGGVVPSFVSGVDLCRYATKTYEVGVTFNVKDGCNTCTCQTQGAMTCTNKACLSTGFAKPMEHVRIGDCLYGNKWYRLGDQFAATDGCNTCYCLYPGDFAGYTACTGMRCTNSNIING